MTYPWYAWLILTLAWAICTAGFWWVFRSMPRHGKWMQWVFGALPTLIVLPFVVAALRGCE